MVELLDELLCYDHALTRVEALLLAVTHDKALVFGFAETFLVLEELSLCNVIPAESLLEDLVFLADVLAKGELLGAIRSLT